MNTQHRIISMTQTPAGRYVRVTFENGGSTCVRPREIMACDVRVGDMAYRLPDRAALGVILSLRPAGTAPYQH